MVLEIFVIARYKLILVLFNVIVTFVHLVLLRNVSNVCVCVRVFKHNGKGGRLYAC